MSSALHPRLAGPPPRDTEYCVDCYADGGRVTVARRKFKQDPLCERHYIALCKEMEIEPGPLNDAAAGGQVLHNSQCAADGAAKKTRSSRSVSSGPTAGVLTRPEGMPLSEQANGITSEHRNQARHGGETSTKVSESPDIATDVTAALGAQGYKLRDAQRAVEQTYKPGDTFDQAFKKALAIVSTSRAGGRPVAPAAEGGTDRAHIPDSGPAFTRPGRSNRTSAVSLNPQTRKESTMAPKKLGSASLFRNEAGERVCSCGCGTVLRSRHPYIKGHNIAPGEPVKIAAPAKHGRKPKSADSPPQQTNGHAAPTRLHATSLQAMAPVAIANGNGSHKVTCQVSELVMDRIWVKLSPEEKAQLLFPSETDGVSQGNQHA